jgi:hypothetical protein
MNFRTGQTGLGAISTANDVAWRIESMAKPDRTPKKIAGLKLPKEIRQAPAIRSLLATAGGRKVLTDALRAGAAAAAAQVMEAHEAAKAAKSQKLEKPSASAAKPVEANVKPKAAKPSKPAPGAAPANDVMPRAAETLVPLAAKPERIKPERVDPPRDQNGAAEPGAAD